MNFEAPIAGEIWSAKYRFSGYEAEPADADFTGARRDTMVAENSAPGHQSVIDAERHSDRMRNFDLSVLVNDIFMKALDADAGWLLVFDGEVCCTVRASELWKRLMRATYDVAEPGVLFVDRVNARDKLAHWKTINAPNSCGEQMLSPCGACLLGSMNLAARVERPFKKDARLDLAARLSNSLVRRSACSITSSTSTAILSPNRKPKQRRNAASVLALSGWPTRCSIAAAPMAPQTRWPCWRSGGVPSGPLSTARWQDWRAKRVPLRSMTRWCSTGPI
ncbi:hypothetical protein RM533_07550 [Croceicoccus sp. F390]|uniref:Ribonucleotide reductase large subunit C-terminal domain-containing protein n=1 Tax=Croceicoccus esteveae TaxID=3075597 RepID=A0ABU2ZHF5_9SPHN|nr:hypothetical protein [Croceicoccus sp. F390]MDT0576040.1 hypothetical protein [Croceicoccus sp. F390]